MALKCRLTGANIAKINNFWFKFAPKGYVPLSDFYKIWHGWGTPRPAPLCQISPLSLLKCELTAPKVPTLVIFGTNLSQKGYTPLSDFNKIWLGEEVPGPHPHAKFHRSGFKNVGLRPQKSRKMAIIGINLPIRENSGVCTKTWIHVHNYKPSPIERHHNCFENYTAS